ncbi:hypothetical protein SY88_12575 [Clostridiales bacterium PH28_bin88]|nr:hypothetical protein SY88_12575 [Clostridiales bacterium PH28_bin88]
MKKALIALPLVAVLALLVGSAWWADPFRGRPGDGEGEPLPKPAPSQHLDGVVAANFPTYDIDAKYDVEAGTIHGEMAITYRNPEEKPLGHFQLNLVANTLSGKQGAIKVSQVKVNGQPVEPEASLSSVRVPFATSLGKGEKVRVSLKFETIVPDGPWRLGRYQGVSMVAGWYPLVAPWWEGDWQAFPSGISFGDPYYAESAYYKVRLTVPRGIKVVAGADILTQRSLGEDTLWFFQTSRPVREFAFAASRDFKYTVERVGETLVVFAYTGREDRTVMEAAARSLDYFQQLLGDYPYRQFTVARVPLQGYAGMEYPAIVFISSIEPYGPFTVAHEVAHQWWYNLVGNNQISEPWVDEGLANFMALLYSREYERDRYPGRLREFAATPGGPGFARPLTGFASAEEYKRSAYVRGTMFWHQAYQDLGEERVMGLLRNIQENYRFQVVTWQDIRQMLLEVGVDPAAIP